MLPSQNYGATRGFGVAGIALGRDLNAGNVDVLGTQLEEVPE